MSDKIKKTLVGIIIVIIILFIGIIIAFLLIRPKINISIINNDSRAEIMLLNSNIVKIYNKKNTLKKEPVSLSVESSSDDEIGFNLYISLDDSTIDLSQIKYIITNNNSKDVIMTGTLKEGKIFNSIIPSVGLIAYDIYFYTENNSFNFKDNINLNLYIETYNRTATYLNDYIKGLYTIDGANNIYYHDGQGNYENALLEAEDNSYRYSGGDYILTEKAKREGFNMVNSIGDEPGIINYYCGDKIDAYLCNDGTENIRLGYNNKRVFDNYNEVIKQAIKDGYLKNNNVNNFVCFGSYSATCDNNDLYRIIGVFDDKVKLVKYDYATIEQLGTNGNYENNYKDASGDIFIYYRGHDSLENIGVYNFNEEYNYDLKSSDFINVNLNTNYLNYLGDNWANLIDKTNWKIYEFNYYEQNNSDLNKDTKEIFELEKNVINTYNAKVALMNASDYLYAAHPSNWSYFASGDDTINYGYSINNNWIYNGFNEALIGAVKATHENLTLMFQLRIFYGGIVSFFPTDLPLPVRQTFYLKENVEYVGGIGSINNPIRIM